MHVWEPIPDRAPAPSIDWLRGMVDLIDRQRKAGMTTFIHCSSGKSRSAMLVAAYLMQKNHWSRSQALAHLRSQRPLTNPNPAFMKLLLDRLRKAVRTQ